jgi:hypothetical protein
MTECGRLRHEDGGLEGGDRRRRGLVLTILDNGGAAGTAHMERSIASAIWRWVFGDLKRPKPEWPNADVANGLNAAFQFANESAQWIIDWYDAKNKRKKFWSFVWRGAAIVTSALGILLPVVPVEKSDELTRLSQYGYFAALLAIAFLTVDRSFGFTSSWVRTVTASRAVETALFRFRADWLKLSVEPPASHRDLVQCLHDFVMTVRTIVDEEAKAWATETLANFSQLERVIGTNVDEARKRYESLAESARAGALRVTVTNPAKTGAWVYNFSVNGSQRKSGWPTPSCGIANVSPGLVEIDVAADTSDGSASRRGSTVVRVPNGEVVNVEIELNSQPSSELTGTAAGNESTGLSH